MPLTQKQFEREREIKPRKIKVMLAGEDKETMFFCPFCRSPIMKHCQRMVMILPEENMGNMPIELKCKNKNCGTIFTFYTLA